MSFAFPTDHAEVGNQSVVCRLSLEVLGFPVRVSSSVVTRTTIALASRGEYPLAYREDSFGLEAPGAGGGGGAAGGRRGGGGSAGGGSSSSSSSASPSGSPDVGWTFAVSLRDCGEADYLVSERRYNESVRHAWKPAERVMMEWKEEEEEGEEAVLKPYFGAVVKLERDQSGSEHWPNSPWGCLHIKWDLDGSTNSLGPWEPRPVREAMLLIIEMLERGQRLVFIFVMVSTFTWGDFFSVVFGGDVFVELGVVDALFSDGSARFCLVLSSSPCPL